MESNIITYIALLALIIIGVTVVKKVTSCMIKSIVTVVLVALAAVIYWMYLR